MRKISILILILLFSQPVYAQSPIVLGATNTFKIDITDPTNYPKTGVVLADVNFEFACSGDAFTATNETGDTLTQGDATDEPGRYWYTSNDTLTGCGTGDELQVCVSGTNISGRCTTYRVIAAEIGQVTGMNADTVTASAIAVGAITSSEAPNLDAAISTRATNDGVVTSVSGTASSGTTTTLVDAARTEADTDYWKDSCLLITSGTVAGQMRRISAFNATTDTITVDTAFTQAISTNTYIILRTSLCSAGGGTADWTTVEKENIRDALGVTGTKTAASGGQLQTVKTKTDQLTFTVANQVDSNDITKTGYSILATDKDTFVNLLYDELTSEARTAGSYGQLFKDDINATIGSRMPSSYWCNGAGICSAPTDIGVWNRVDASISDRLSTSQFNTKIPNNLSVNVNGRIGLDLDNTEGTISAAEWSQGAADLVWSSATRSLTLYSDSSGVTTLLTRVPSALSLTAGNVHTHTKASDPTVMMNYADVSAATSGSSFTIATPTDFQGNAITMTTDFLKNRLIKAYTNGGAPCNVNGQGGWVNTVTVGGVVTLDTTTTGSGFTATPSITNCGIIWSP